MARKPRNTPGGYIYHVLNRSAGRIALFRNDADYVAFERVMLEAHRRVPLHILAWCLMKNHWHFVVRPRKDDEVTAFFRWLAHTHAMRWRVARNSVGWGHLYQGRFKAFPVQSGHHLREVCRYVERNALSAGAVKQAQDWRWGSLWVRCQHGRMEPADKLASMLKGEGVKKIGSLSQWVEYVNTRCVPVSVPRDHQAPKYCRFRQASRNHLHSALALFDHSTPSGVCTLFQGGVVHVSFLQPAAAIFLGPAPVSADCLRPGSFRHGLRPLSSPATEHSVEYLPPPQAAPYGQWFVPPSRRRPAPPAGRLIGQHPR